MYGCDTRTVRKELDSMILAYRLKNKSADVHNLPGTLAYNVTEE